MGPWVVAQVVTHRITDREMPGLIPAGSWAFFSSLFYPIRICDLNWVPRGGATLLKPPPLPLRHWVQLQPVKFSGHTDIFQPEPEHFRSRKKIDLSPTLLRLIGWQSFFISLFWNVAEFFFTEIFWWNYIFWQKLGNNKKTFWLFLKIIRRGTNPAKKCDFYFSENDISSNQIFF